MTFHCRSCGLDFSQTEPAEHDEYKDKCPRCGGDDVYSPLKDGMLPPTAAPLEAHSEDEPEPVPEQPDVPADKVPPTTLPKPDDE
jgi:hypothetical protein